MTIIVESSEPSRDYAYLLGDIADWLHRSDLTAKIPQFIRMAETKMSEDLDARAMQVSTTLTAIPGYGITLPADLKSVKRLRHVDTPGYPLNYAAPDELARVGQFGDSGRPILYTTIGSSVEFAPKPDAAYEFVLDYERRIVPLTEFAPSNWLIERSYSAYLFGALMFARIYIQDEARAATVKAMYDEAIGAINLNDWHSGGALRVRTDNH